MQIQEMLSASTEISVSNTRVSDEIYYGYTLSFKYNQTSFYWSDGNTIYLRDNNLRGLSMEISPAMSGKEILSKLQEFIEKM